MTEVLDITRGTDQMAETEARQALEVLMPIVEAAPLDGEATEVIGHA